ncbi:CLUMA_CG020631, isoform C, partial [Clunio marinus]
MFSITMTLLTCFFLITISIILCLVYFRRKFQYFTKRNIIGPKPTLFGNTKEAFFKRKHLTYEVGKIYEILHKLCIKYA